ncbi:MAG: YbhB/YbcL family Raf kinase inhibitor-like protein [Okeania sp. SIO2C2]|uniref:YbhB/YbcL family Raf kinase inhibitor-like protein n=1 Tax=Okeania sp. SIO2C2 TaxID=2607787 RepID=UPI0013B9B495|nr:YbhB/YbcL family Raf kinase inhibitor-like protein [Okeania sp. SIO2C2]NEP86341.1 YbhB/YbcL family Raf kinase inhibitor-like protein [Okeania sp. SIO2C2]
MKLWSDNFSEGGKIPEEFAFGKYHPEKHMELSDNKNPHLAWSDLPKGTRSLVLICHDPDVPSVFDDAEQEGKIVAASLPRVDFYHWVLVDILPDIKSIAPGEFSDGVIPGGKSGPEAPLGTRQGINDYTQGYVGDPEMAGDYFGYDGPCPPWNDEKIHHYHFTLYALNLDCCPVEGRFSSSDVLQAIEGNILEKAALTGTYHIYPNPR